MPRTITAAYKRGDMTPVQVNIMVARYARDPAAAQAEVQHLRKLYGDEFYKYVDITVLVRDNKTFLQRLLTLFRRAFGESDYVQPRIRHRSQLDCVVLPYKFRQNEDRS